MIFAQRPHGCWLTMKDDQSRVSLRYSLVLCEIKGSLREGRSRDGQSGHKAVQKFAFKYYNCGLKFIGDIYKWTIL